MHEGDDALAFLGAAEDPEDQVSDFASPTEADGHALAVGVSGGSPVEGDAAYFGKLEVDDAMVSMPAAMSEGGQAQRQRKRRKRSSSSGSGGELPSLPFASVVKVFVKKAPWTYTAPWRKDSQKASMGSGFLLGSKRLLITNAHVVHRATSVIVQAQAGAPAKYAAKVVCIGREIDLAILKVEDESFWANKTELEVRRDRCSCCAIPSRPARIYALTSLSNLYRFVSRSLCAARQLSDVLPKLDDNVT